MLREDRTAMVFENRLPTNLFVPTTEEVTGRWKELHIEYRNDLYTLPNISRIIKEIRVT
jgi:hypothetical protein